VFRKSFVLQYATYLGFDRGAISTELKHLSAFDDEPAFPGDSIIRDGPDVPPMTPSQNWSWLTGSLGSFTGVVVVVLVCAGLWMVWEKYSSPAATPPAASTKPAPAVRAPAPVAVEPPKPEPAASTASPVEAPKPAPELSPATGQPVSVALTANEETWVQVVSDGKRILSNVIPAAGRRVVGANERMRILVGNAGGIEISLNGKPIGPIGPRGQVRTVELTPDGFQIVPPPQTQPSAPL